jgi:hypothetical protein
MRRYLTFALLSLGVVLASPARAGEIILGLGGRMGVTLSPNQVHVGMHADLGELVENLHLRPNVELGVGSDRTVLAVNPEVVYMFRDRARGKLTPYAGGGLGFNFISWEDRSHHMDDDDFGVGLNLLGGVEYQVSDKASVFFESKFGVGDSPDVKLAFGFTILR